MMLISLTALRVIDEKHPIVKKLNLDKNQIKKEDLMRAYHTK